MVKRYLHSLIFGGKLLVIAVSLSSILLLHDSTWLAEVNEIWSCQIDFDKNEAENENERFETEIDVFIKDSKKTLKKQPVIIERTVMQHSNIPVSLCLDVTTPPPEPA